MPVKVTKEEKIVELAILKAKEFLQHAGHLGTVELEDDTEDVKVKRPKENPKEKKLDNPTGDGYGEVSGDAYHKSEDLKKSELITIGEKVVKSLGELLKDEALTQLEIELIEENAQSQQQLLEELKQGIIDADAYTVELRRLLSEIPLGLPGTTSSGRVLGGKDLGGKHT